MFKKNNYGIIGIITKARKKGAKMFQFFKKNYANLFSLLNIVVLIVTLFVLFRYADDTKIIAEQTKQGNLRPVVLRSGYLTDWNDVKSKTISKIPKEEIEKLISQKNKKLNTEVMAKTNQPEPLQFTILKNIATNISGFATVDGRKYTLLFANAISQKTYNGKLTLTNWNPNWAWMKADTIIYAFLDPLSAVKTNEDNQIFINYKDIEGNSYCTKEDKYFTQKSISL
jgi:hypothetical protein